MLSPAEFIAAIAWPAAILIVALLFRRPLVEALASATGKLAAGPFSLEWERQVTDVEDDLGLPSPISKGQFGDAAGEFDGIAHDHPPAAIVESFAQVETSLRTVLKENGVEDLGTSWSVKRLADRAREEGLITAETHNAIEGLNVLRNLAVHGGASDISPQRAQEFTALAQGVGYAITTNAKRRNT